ncbi:hypothetical protein A9Z64_05300 [Moraxella osloensis]|jgi:siderophore synthetase component|uniref:Aerobactin synthase IucA n=1 Tax=Faucicola osloensis TaxID=34062 RepID=A0A378QVJ7_FAUOS|nr:MULTISPECIES: IucA/IucC family protein [Moraxella]NPA79318.1 IucA/IucC family siderophore biosynthesis protein [Gammaproteobacteria bacterium]AME02583.1 hypothetical protein AXE82_11770 [Moraxella osloensis]MBW4016880.1 IucA/IucC family siderophore biosynthesis protein [Moraxella osloensis]OBX57207.1 hypothetical protein A9Z64_05300 [Moraxella osloensis]STZ04936.1 Aerobactin synthase IucA [Moraxella osloensis]
MPCLTEHIDRLSVQNLINAYCIEINRFKIIKNEKFNNNDIEFFDGKDVLVLTLLPLQQALYIPLHFFSILGQHQIFGKIYVRANGGYVEINSLTTASLILADIQYHHSENLDTFDVLSRWIESHQKLVTIMLNRAKDFETLFASDTLNFIETEQALIYGHAMHPTPKARIGFNKQQWINYSPETKGCFNIHYWLVHPDNTIEESFDGKSISRQLLEYLTPFMPQEQKKLFLQFPCYKLLPLHPWQAKFLQDTPFYKQLVADSLLIDIGETGTSFFPTTSVRTVASFDAPWMLKFSLSVAITNAVRINLPKECRRGMFATKIWHSEVGETIKSIIPSFNVINDPAWIGLKIDDDIIHETICIFRHNPFNQSDNVTNLATLCQDHPLNQANRFSHLFEAIAQQKNLSHEDIAINWFNQFLTISLDSMLQIYHTYGMVFEAHQQNSLLELDNHLPAKFWVRDNQSFGYVIDYAETLIATYPELHTEAQCVVPVEFASHRFIYYFIGNSVFSVITAIAKTGATTEIKLIDLLYQHIERFYQLYPDSLLLQTLLFQDELPYKGNLLTRLHQLDELIAPVETQSIYVDIKNPIQRFNHESECIK